MGLCGGEVGRGIYVYVAERFKEKQKSPPPQWKVNK